MLLQQANPALANESQYVQIREATASPYAGFMDLNHPEIIWINSDDVYTPEMMRGQLAHELTHHMDWRNGLLTKQTCGEDYFQAEYRAYKAQYSWSDWADTVMRNYIRANIAECA